MTPLLSLGLSILVISSIIFVTVSILSNADRRKKILVLYKNIAIFLLNTFLLFIAINAVLWGIIIIHEQIQNITADKETLKNPVSNKYQTDLRTVYPEYDSETIDALLNETWSRPYVYEPFTQFKERSYHGNYVNVSEFGFRVTKIQKSWPPDEYSFNIFLFGGSSTFGYGVADHETVASYLEDFFNKNVSSLPIYVYNFGRGFYYSTQELILLLRLLSSGYVPNMVIFVDGLNEFYHSTDEPFFTSRIRDFVNGRYAHRLESKFRENLKENTILNKLPLYRAALYLKKTFLQPLDREHDEKSHPPLPTVTETYNNEEILRNVVNRYIMNIKLIDALGHAYSVKTAFVWQPVPTYKYDLKYHLFAGGGFDKHTYSKYGYPYMKEYLSLNPPGKNFIWAADIQENLKEPLYVDKVHYTSNMSKLLAKYIGHEILQRDLL